MAGPWIEISDNLGVGDPLWVRVKDTTPTQDRKIELGVGAAGAQVATYECSVIHWDNVLRTIDKNRSPYNNPARQAQGVGGA